MRKRKKRRLFNLGERSRVESVSSGETHVIPPYPVCACNFFLVSLKLKWGRGGVLCVIIRWRVKKHFTKEKKKKKNITEPGSVDREMTLRAKE